MSSIFAERLWQKAYALTVVAVSQPQTLDAYSNLTCPSNPTHSFSQPIFDFSSFPDNHFGPFVGDGRHAPNTVPPYSIYTQSMGAAQIFGQSQTTPLAFSSQYSSDPSSSQSAGFSVGLEAAGNLSNIQLRENQDSANNIEVNYNTQQTQWKAHTPHIGSFLDPASPVWGLPPVLPNGITFDFNTEKDGQYGVPMTRQSSIVSSILSDPSALQISSPSSRSMRCRTDSESPDQYDPMDGLNMLECQWQLDGRTCGRFFGDIVDFHNHVVDHVQKQEPSKQHGFICQWRGCVRQPSDHHEGKLGFEGRSKLKRHMNIHTGSGT